MHLLESHNLCQTKKVRLQFLQFNPCNMLQFPRKEAKWLESFLFNRQSQFWLAAWRVLIVDPDKAAELLNTSERPNYPKSAMILKYRKGSRYSLAVQHTLAVKNLDTGTWTFCLYKSQWVVWIGQILSTDRALNMSVGEYLLDGTLGLEEDASAKQLGKDTAHRPDVDGVEIVPAPHQDLWCSVVLRHHLLSHVTRLVQLLHSCQAKVTNLCRI